LSTYGLLRDHRKAEIRGWIDQLEGQGCLAREEGEYPTLSLTEHGRRVLHGEGDVRLLRTVTLPPRAEGRRAGRREAEDVMSREAVDGDLFEALRALRRTMAEERGVPPYVIFSDASLREMARDRPTTEEAFLRIKGVGQHKLAELGPRFLARVREHLAGR
jgi:ATP-dependent DNA helicase RecQ